MHEYQNICHEDPSILVQRLILLGVFCGFFQEEIVLAIFEVSLLLFVIVQNMTNTTVPEMTHDKSVFITMTRYHIL